MPNAVLQDGRIYVLDDAPSSRDIFDDYSIEKLNVPSLTNAVQSSGASLTRDLGITFNNPSTYQRLTNEAIARALAKDNPAVPTNWLTKFDKVPLLVVGVPPGLTPEQVLSVLNDIDPVNHRYNTPELAQQAKEKVEIVRQSNARMAAQNIEDAGGVSPLAAVTEQMMFNCKQWRSNIRVTQEGTTFSIEDMANIEGTGRATVSITPHPDYPDRVLIKLDRRFSSLGANTRDAVKGILDGVMDSRLQEFHDFVSGGRPHTISSKEIVRIAEALPAQRQRSIEGNLITDTVFSQIFQEGGGAQLGNALGLGNKDITDTNKVLPPRSGPVGKEANTFEALLERGPHPEIVAIEQIRYARAIAAVQILQEQGKIPNELSPHEIIRRTGSGVSPAMLVQTANEIHVFRQEVSAALQAMPKPDGSDSLLNDLAEMQDKARRIARENITANREAARESAGFNAIREQHPELKDLSNDDFKRVIRELVDAGQNPSPDAIIEVAKSRALFNRTIEATEASNSRITAKVDALLEADPTLIDRVGNDRLTQLVRDADRDGRAVTREHIQQAIAQRQAEEASPEFQDARAKEAELAAEIERVRATMSAEPKPSQSLLDHVLRTSAEAERTARANIEARKAAVFSELLNRSISATQARIDAEPQTGHTQARIDRGTSANDDPAPKWQSQPVQLAQTQDRGDPQRAAMQRAAKDAPAPQLQNPQQQQQARPTPSAEQIARQARQLEDFKRRQESLGSRGNAEQVPQRQQQAQAGPQATNQNPELALKRKYAEYFSGIIDKLGMTPDGDLLLSEGPHGVPRVSFEAKLDMSPGMPVEMVFEYPNTLQTIVPPLPESGDYTKPDANNPHFEAKVALAAAHELLHRQQAYRPGMGPYFMGQLPPLPGLTGELLVEADNYARTAQVGWRMAYAEQDSYPEIGDYMRAADPTNPMESHYAVYAAAMDGKPITPENELVGMRAVVSDFLFTSQNSQRYAANRVALLSKYLESGELQRQLAHQEPSTRRSWLIDQPSLAGLGPDAAPFNAEHFVGLGATEAGNIFDIQPGFMEHIRNPAFASVFMNDNEQARIQAIHQFSAALTEALKDHPAPQLQNPQQQQQARPTPSVEEIARQAQQQAEFNQRQASAAPSSAINTPKSRVTDILPTPHTPNVGPATASNEGANSGKMGYYAQPRQAPSTRTPGSTQASTAGQEAANNNRVSSGPEREGSASRTGDVAPTKDGRPKLEQRTFDPDGLPIDEEIQARLVGHTNQNTLETPSVFTTKAPEYSITEKARTLVSPTLDTSVAAGIMANTTAAQTSTKPAKLPAEQTTITDTTNARPPSSVQIAGQAARDAHAAKIHASQRAGGTAGAGLGINSLRERLSEGGSSDKARQVGGVQLGSEIAAGVGDFASILTGVPEILGKTGTVATQVIRRAPIVAAGATLLEMNAANIAQDGRRSVAAGTGFVGGMPTGIVMGAVTNTFVGARMGRVAGLWGAAAGGLVGAFAGGYLASDAGKQSLMGDTQQRDLDRTAQRLMDETIVRLRDITQKPATNWSEEEKSFVRDSGEKMLTHYHRMRVLEIPETDIDGRMRQEFQKRQAADVINYLNGEENAPLRTSIEIAGAYSRQLDALLPALSDGKLGWRPHLDADKDGKLSRADILATLSKYDIDIHTLQPDAKGDLNLAELTRVLKTIKADQPDRVERNGRSTAVVSSVPTVLDTVHGNFAGRFGYGNFSKAIKERLPDLEKLGVADAIGMQGKKLTFEDIEKTFKANGIRVGDIDRDMDGQITTDEIMKALQSRGLGGQAPSQQPNNSGTIGRG